MSPLFWLFMQKAHRQEATMSFVEYSIILCDKNEVLLLTVKAQERLAIN
jgi:hypothetical protein